MKKIAGLSLFCLLLVFPAVARCQEPTSRALFVSVIQDPPVLSDRQAIRDLVSFSKKARIGTLFVQVYRANKAWFPSKAADSEPYQSAFQNISEDPFALLIKESHAAGIQVHAWLNLMSLSTNADAPILKKYGPEILTRNRTKKTKLEDYKIDDQYFLEPGDPRVREELATVVEELARRYPELDGIQFDYIRYPDLHPAYGHTKINSERFKKETGAKMIDEQSAAWKNWKRAQVTGLLELLAGRARAVHPGIQVSTTGLMPYSRAYLEAFQDWRAWVRSGLIDFVTLMCYHIDDRTLKSYVRDARNQLGSLGKADLAVGAYTFLNSPRQFARQFDICEASNPRACAVLHYGSFVQNPALQQPLLRSKKT